jgi:nucleoside-diphosphate-sugar epimerase
VNILIIGNTSYIGISFKKWLNKWPDKYKVDSLSIRDDDWKKVDFSIYDVLFHVAAIVHKKNHQEEVYKVNRDLAIKVATKAKLSGVKQFIFMSSIAVYGLYGEIGKEIVISEHTLCNPNTSYGKSKLQAEIELNKLNDDKFHIAIIRSPMVYGKHCLGNYRLLRKLVRTIPIAFCINNQRSMVYIDNLVEFIRLIIEHHESGLFFPQNKDYVSTNKLMQLIANQHSITMFSCRFCAFGILALGRRFSVIKKMFGNLMIDIELSSYRNFEYCIYNLEDSIKIIENPQNE